MTKRKSPKTVEDFMAGQLTRIEDLRGERDLALEREKVLVEVLDRLGDGVSRRDHFAAAALQGLLSNAGNPGYDYKGSIGDIAKDTVRYADALIAELDRKT